MSDETATGVLERPKVHRENRKKNRGRKVEDNQAQAIAKFIRVPPRKARLVINEVRGKYASDALAFLGFIPNRAAGYIAKVLASAVANAANNHGLNPNNLKLIEARVDEGPRMKRVQPRAQGRAYRILKRMSHITVIVEEVEPKPRKPKKPATKSRAQAAREARQPQPTAVAPVETEETKVTTATVTEVTTAPQTANPDTTDEIGAPIMAEATVPVAVENTAETAAAETAETPAVESGPETANAEDTTDEIGAPADADAKG